MIRSFARRWIACNLFVAIAAALSPAALAMQVTISGPGGSVAFGTRVRALPNGHFLVTDPEFSFPGVPRVGAVHLYDARGERIRTLTGSRAEDQVGSGGVVVLANGHAVALSPLWGNGDSARAGAVTWIDADTGTGGLVSAANSLVGSNIDDKVGSRGVWPLSNGHYVVRSLDWNFGSVARAGAVTWGNGNGGTVGEVGAGNSLIGTQPDDQIGSHGIVRLANGNYVVVSPLRNRTSVVDAGAVTWCSGAEGCRGTTGPGNSLVGSRAGDRLGVLADGDSPGVVALDNGHYVVASPLWDDDALEDVGAVTWGDGTNGVEGDISSQNSLVGSQPRDRIGGRGATPLRNGHYAVSSPGWDHGATPDVGAITWGNGAGASVGVVSTANSLVGNVAEDRLGRGGVVALDNGNYVVVSPDWSATDVGAVTWVDGGGPRSGIVSIANSVVGSTAQDLVAATITPLVNGHYVIGAPQWNRAETIDAGAVQWADGDVATAGTIADLDAKALVGSAAGDRVGGRGVTALSNGHYVAASPDWDGGSSGRGAVTWRHGSVPSPAVVSGTNSLVGSRDEDYVGSGGVVALAHGRYVVGSDSWSTSTEIDVGAVTWINGNQFGLGTAGIVSQANSLVGSSENDRLGQPGGISALPDGSFVLESAIFNANQFFPDTGAIAWPRPGLGETGTLSQMTSVIPGAIGGGDRLNWSHDRQGNRLIVGRPAEGVVTLFETSLFRDGFE